MTREEFTAAYALRSGVTVARLSEAGQRAYPCNCDYEGCHGWAMMGHEAALDEVALGRLTESDLYGDEVRWPIVVDSPLPTDILPVPSCPARPQRQPEAPRP